MIRKFALALSILVLGTTGFADDRFTKKPSDLTREEVNALAVLAPQTKSVYFSASLVQQIVSELQAIKSQFPELVNAYDYGARITAFKQIIVGSDDPLSTRVEKLVAKALSVRGPMGEFSTGTLAVPELESQVDIAAIDALVPIEAIFASYHVGKNRPLRVSYVLLELSAAVNVPYLLQQITKKEVKYLSGNTLMGDGTRILRCANSPSKIEYTISLGSGDCPAGCIHRLNYRFAVDPVSKAVTKMGIDEGKAGACGQ